MLQTIKHPDEILELRLQRPPVNALNPAMVKALGQALRDGVDQGASALLLSGQPGVFTGGLDLPELLTLDPKGMQAFWGELVECLRLIACCPVPMACALTGHSPAGGTIMALFADYRVMARGDYQLGLNEVQVGLVVPPFVQAALARQIGARQAEQHLVAGRMISPEQALQLGLVDQLAQADQVIPAAIEWLRQRLGSPTYAMLAMRNICRRDLQALFDDPTALDLQPFMDFWFDDNSQTRLQQIAARLGKSG